MKHIKTGWYEKNHSANSTGYSVLAGDYMSRAYANSVLGKERVALEEDLRTCLHYAVQSLDARDPRNPDYNEAHEKEYPYTESEALEDIQYSLMAGDFEMAKHFAGSLWLVGISEKGFHKGYEPGLTQRTSKDRRDNYATALANFILGNDKTAKEIIELIIKNMEKRGIPKISGSLFYFYSQYKALSRIIDRDENTANDGIAMQLQFAECHRCNPHSEYYGIPQSSLSEEAIALANLALLKGLKVRIEHCLLPKALLCRIDEIKQ
jgi:hypothetical protein